MGLFWKRKSGDQFVSLKLNEPRPEQASEKTSEEALATPAANSSGSTKPRRAELSPLN
jgi:hypothetical protein